MNELLIRRIGMVSGLLGAIFLLVAGMASNGAGTNLPGYIGIVLAVVGWVATLLYQLRKRSVQWLAFLGAFAALGILIGLLQISPPPGHHYNLIFAFMPIALSGFIGSATEERSIVARASIAAISLTCLLVIIISGALPGGGGTGTPIAAGVSAMSVQFFFIAGLFAIVAYVAAIIESIRTTAWGWLVANIVLFGIGPLMYGLFGPSRLDLRASRAQAEAKRVAGVR